MDEQETLIRRTWMLDATLRWILRLNRCR